jgi:hypothetical protein
MTHVGITVMSAVLVGIGMDGFDLVGDLGMPEAFRKGPIDTDRQSCRGS